MTLTLSRRVWARIVTFALAAIIILGIYGIIMQQRNTQARRELKNSYVRSISELSSHVENISTDLTKSMYAGTAEQMEVLTNSVWKESGYAKSSLSQLPTNDLHLTNTYKLLSQVGEYARSLAKKVADGEEITEDERSNLGILNNYCADMQEQLLIIQDEIQTGSITFDEVQNATTTGLQQENEEQEQSAGIDSGFKTFEDGIQSYPTLIYDGPFSDHIMEKEPELIQGQQDVTREQAKEKAAQASSAEGSELKDDTDEEGKMPLYCFYTGTINVSVTKQGGYLAYMINSRLVYEEKISVEDAKESAHQYLESLGIKNLTESYYEINNNVMTVNFAAQDGDITCYTDLIKVSVAMDNGEVTGFDARGYITNHHSRDYTAIKISKDEAEKSLSSILTVDSVKLALIPTQGTDEKLTYEFTCTGLNDQKVLVYVNVENGDEEQILILIENENGVLTT